MKRIYTAMITVTAVMLLGSAAHAQVTLNSVRVGAQDTAVLAKFYEAAFGMFEVNRINVPGGAEIFVNFGATADAAKANKRGARSPDHASRFRRPERPDRARHS